MKYKLAVTFFSAALVASSLAAPTARAWDSDGRPNAANTGFESKRGLSGGDPDQSFREFLNNGNNNDFARRYRENPNIIYDKDVMAHEPGVRAYMDAHPQMRAEAYGHAGAKREKRWERKQERRANGW